MTTRPQLPGVRWFLWLRNDALRAGVLTGIYLSCIFLAWLWIANRIPRLESFAAMRNLIAGAAVILLMSIPVLRFHNQPIKLFVSGGTAWTLLTLVFRAMEMRFSLLESRVGAFHVLMLGVICYGFIAVFQWVFLLCAKARQDYIAHARQADISATRRHN